MNFPLSFVFGGINVNYNRTQIDIIYIKLLCFL
jgi:hypothetical protein